MSEQLSETSPSEGERLPPGVEEAATGYLASRLIACGLGAGRSLSRDPDYRHLVALWGANEDGFRTRVLEIASGLGLRVADVSPQFGIVLVPSSRHSPFASRTTDIRRRADAFSTGAIAIVQVAVAAAFFPTADLLADGSQPLPQRVGDVLRVLNTLIARFEASGSSDDERQAAAWGQLSALPERIDGARRASLSSREGIVAIVLADLAATGLLRETGDTAGPLYTATHRWRVQVRDASGHDLYRLCCRLRGASEGL